MTAVALQTMTPDDFLVWSLDQTDRWELVQGVPVRMMTGATQAHDRVVVNCIAELRDRLRGKPCRPSTADIAARMVNDNVRRPDVTVDCGPVRPTALDSTEPVVFVEVLSPSTRGIDLVRKAEEYKAVPTLRHIVLIEPDRPQVWLWSRTDVESAWTSQELLGLDPALDLFAIQTALPLAAIYDGIAFEA